MVKLSACIVIRHSWFISHGPLVAWDRRVNYEDTFVAVSCIPRRFTLLLAMASTFILSFILVQYDC